MRSPSGSRRLLFRRFRFILLAIAALLATFCMPAKASTAAVSVTISGTVRNADGDPVAGAQVILQEITRLPFFPWEYTDDEVTGEDGSFSITRDCTACALRALAPLAGTTTYLTSQVGGYPGFGTENPTIDVTLPRAVTGTLHVTDSDGKPMNGAFVGCDPGFYGSGGYRVSGDYAWTLSTISFAGYTNGNGDLTVRGVEGGGMSVCIYPPGVLFGSGVEPSYFSFSMVDGAAHNFRFGAPPAPTADVPAAPMVTSVTPGNHSATLTWLKPADGGSPILGYTVTADPGGRSCSTDSADELSCTVTGLTNGVNYTFTVTARNAVGVSPTLPDGQNGTGGLTGPVIPGTPPAPVTDLEVERDASDGTSVTLHWLAAASDLPIIGYRATADPGGSFCTTEGALSCTITGLTPTVDYSFTVVAINGIGSSAPSDPVDLPKDETPPTVTASFSAEPLHVGNTDWFAAPVTVTWNVNDNEGGSGVSEANVPPPTTVSSSRSVSSGSVCDNAGNCSTASVEVGIDTVGPEIAVLGVENGHKYLLGEAPPVSTCTATDAGVGTAGDCRVSVNGGNAYGVGTFVVTATATDRLGNQSTMTVRYKVVYPWSGYLQPIDDPDADSGAGVSVFRAGSVVPAKFSLTDAAGAVVQPVTPPIWLTPVRGSAMTLPVDETIYSVPTDSGTSYRSTDGRWQYNWRTDKEQAGFHWRLGVRLDDGETHYVTIALR